ncbi:MAG TPA: RidA family protein [Opitutales bacterium]|nr:RidA family protein [Opitutales bacterium]
MDYEKILAELGFALPPPPAPAGNYLPFVRSGRLVFLAGTLPLREGALTHAGQVGRELDVAAGYAAAQVCALNTLAALKAAAGSFDQLERFVLVNGFVNGVAGFADSPAVINGASDLLVKVFGDRGRHARAAVAVAGLPKNAAVEIQCVAELKE